MAKGYLAKRYPCEEGEYSDLKVLRSNAGYYIGTMFVHNGKGDLPSGFEEPGSRESGYYATKEEAETALKNNDWEQRPNP